MTFARLLERWDAWDQRDAVMARPGTITYWELALSAFRKHAALTIPPGSVVAVVGDFTPETISWQYALWAHQCIVVPIGPTWRTQIERVIDLTEAEYVVESGFLRACSSRLTPSHELYQELRRRGSPGLVLLTSGTTGTPKAVVHDASKLLAKVAKKGKTHRTLGFLSYDHVGGQNTLLYCLCHGGLFVSEADRSPDAICRAIEQHRVELLPTSPSFLRMLLLSGALDRYLLDSLKLITYGSETMPEFTLKALNEALPNVAKLQQFGMSEVGVLRSRSKSDDSTWIKLGGPEFEVRVVDGHLEVKAETAMLGYLNAPSPFTVDGWLQTGDLAEQDGEWIRILGRDTDVINVGGEKVHPAEVESVIEQMEGVMHAVVRKEPNPILGHFVAVSVRLSFPEPADVFRRRLRAFCKSRLPKHMIPQKIEITEEGIAGIKKSRAA